MPAQRAGIQSVEVGFSLLQVLGTSPGPLMLRDLAAAAGMSAAKAHRYLVSFQRLQLVTQDPGTTRYDLGPAALTLGLASLSRLDSVKLARQRMAPLMEQIGQTLALAVWGNQGPTIVHWEESPQAITVNLRLGDVMPLLTSATGLCFSAFMAQPAGESTRPWANNSHQSHDRLPPLLRDELARMQKLARKDVPRSMAEVTALLDEVRRRGMARVVDTLLPGVAGFCAPVFDADGHLVLGMVTLGSLANFDPDWDGAVARPLSAAARQLSSDLGYANA
ncbi:MAG: IclR family transcriptional regulator [Pseudomonadota bacterium]|uniref:IclR family transcriptional regulator n=1 Tax=Polaromonas sp. TaxID=1869339 RepID=UPI0018299B43|nr:IclR family transcriptional regulator [Polaromonas sp.]MBA3592499.1 IclR family transcriptional regulator [Polaromonas sp.]MDQ3271431.1 IclR family transcriptional regulator [Pseudomonadota bacterium]